MIVADILYWGKGMKRYLSISFSTTYFRVGVCTLPALSISLLPLTVFMESINALLTLIPHIQSSSCLHRPASIMFQSRSVN